MLKASANPGTLASKHECTPGGRTEWKIDQFAKPFFHCKEWRLFLNVAKYKNIKMQIAWLCLKYFFAIDVEGKQEMH